MKKLAWAQMQLYEYGIDEIEYNERYKHYIELYNKQMKKYSSNKLMNLSLATMQRIHTPLKALFKTKLLFNRKTFEIIADKHTTSDRPIIFAVTHIGKFDIEMLIMAIKEHCVVLTSDFEHLSNTFDGFFISLNGVLYFCHSEKEMRQRVSDKMISTLKSGGNIMYFPEGTWNMTPNLPMLPCYWGIIDVAQKGGADIVPVAIEQYGKHFKINIGANIRFKECNSLQEKTECITSLRDTMATLKWEIWESEPKLDIETISKDYWSKYQKARFKEWPYITKKCIKSFGVNFSDEEFVRYNLVRVEDLKFKPKNATSPDEVFLHLNQLTPSSNTAFLYNKRNHF